MATTVPVNVLIVEDDITLRNLFVLQLDKLGVRADSAINGVEAVRRVHDYRYELILMDIQMPDMNGYEATAAIRLYEKQQHLEPVVIVAVSAQIDAKLCKEAGMNDWIEKPLLMDTLRDLVSRWLRK